MMRLKLRELVLPGTLLLLLFSTGCSIMGAPRTGKLMNMETGEPIEDAVVVVLWEGESGLLEPESFCYNIKSDITNENGRYWTGLWFGITPLVWHTDVIPQAYKEGFVEPKTYTTENWGDIFMVPFRGTREERFEYLDTLLNSTRCNKAGFSHSNHYRIRKRIYEEAERIAVTDKEKEIAYGFKVYAAEALFPEKINNTFNEELQKEIVDRIIKEHP